MTAPLFGRRLIATSIAMTLACTSIAVAASPKKAATEAFKRGKAFYDVGEYDEALRQFQSGYDLYPATGFLVTIGQCQRKLGKLDQARSSYQRFLETDEGNAKVRAEVQDALAEVDAELAKQDVVAQETDTEAPPMKHEPAPGANLTVAQTPQPKKKVKPWVWGLVGAGAALVVGGVVVGVVLGTRHNESASLGIYDTRSP